MSCDGGCSCRFSIADTSGVREVAGCWLAGRGSGGGPLQARPPERSATPPVTRGTVDGHRGSPLFTWPVPLLISCSSRRANVVTAGPTRSGRCEWAVSYTHLRAHETDSY